MAAGWRILILWECELRGEKEELANKLIDFLGPPGLGSVRVHATEQVSRRPEDTSVVLDKES